MVVGQVLCSLLSNLQRFICRCLNSRYIHRFSKRRQRNIYKSKRRLVIFRSNLLSFIALCSFVAYVSYLYFLVEPLLDSYSTQNLNNSIEINPIDRQIVILVGPPKTASTSIQTNLLEWSVNRTSPIIGKNWSWVQPDITCLKQYYNATHSAGVYGAKIWANVPRCISLYKNRSSILCKELFGCYQDSLSMQMSTGKNVVFGSEVFARSIIVERKSEKYMMHLVGSVFNLINTANVAASNLRTYHTISWVVTYRAPRYQHLVSVWHQLRGHQKQFAAHFHTTRKQLTAYFNSTHFSLRSYLSSPYLDLNRLDPLFVAVKLAQYPYSDDSIRVQVVILDMSGVNHTSKDISSIVACEIVSQLPCLQEEYISNEPLIANQNVDMGLNDLTNDEIFKIESILQRLDCNSAHEIRSNPRIRLMYSFLLDDVLSKCKKQFSHYSHEDAIHDIQQIVSFSRIT